ncbi:MAG: YidB family protein [Comamonadaceae bacterium]|nr:YidB family protein [Comamonadaceae bacterium]
MLGRQRGRPRRHGDEEPAGHRPRSSACSARRTPRSAGHGGLGGLVQAFQGQGMGDMISSWISTGPNPPISASQITDVLGHDTLSQFAAKAGVPQRRGGRPAGRACCRR